jgi:NAD(P)-dependent dehydrogenase (short-subunit alcohol dehydrogenase family)
MQDFAGRVAVITGAGGGFGRAFARHAAALGMKLALADVQAESLAATVDELRQQGATVFGEAIDVARSEAVAHLAERTYAEYGAAHLLFNNAGVGCGGYVWENDEADWQWVLGVNLMGVVHGLRHFVSRMRAAEAQGERAHIVNTASVAGWIAPPLMGVYSVSKHAVVALSETLHHDLRLAGSRIGVTCLCPAFVRTGIAEAERSRPRALARRSAPTASMRLAQAALQKAVAAGRTSAAEVARQTFDAIRSGRFYVFTHPQILPAVRERFEHALAGLPPADPYASRPQARPAAEVDASGTQPQGAADPCSDGA